MVFHANDSSYTFSRHASHDFFGRHIRQRHTAESQKFNPLEKWTALWRAIHGQAISTAQNVVRGKLRFVFPPCYRTTK